MIKISLVYNGHTTLITGTSTSQTVPRLTGRWRGLTRQQEVPRICGKVTSSAAGLGGPTLFLRARTVVTRQLSQNGTKFQSTRPAVLKERAYRFLQTHIRAGHTCVVSGRLSHQPSNVHVIYSIGMLIGTLLFTWVASRVSPRVYLCVRSTTVQLRRGRRIYRHTSFHVGSFACFSTCHQRLPAPLGLRPRLVQLRCPPSRLLLVRLVLREEQLESQVQEACQASVAFGFCGVSAAAR